MVTTKKHNKLNFPISKLDDILRPQKVSGRRKGHCQFHNFFPQKTPNIYNISEVQTVFRTYSSTSLSKSKTCMMHVTSALQMLKLKDCWKFESSLGNIKRNRLPMLCRQTDRQTDRKSGKHTHTHVRTEYLSDHWHRNMGHPLLEGRETYTQL